MDWRHIWSVWVQGWEIRALQSLSWLHSLPVITLLPCNATGKGAQDGKGLPGTNPTQISHSWIRSNLFTSYWWAGFSQHSQISVWLETFVSTQNLGAGRCISDTAAWVSSKLRKGACGTEGTKRGKSWKGLCLEWRHGKNKFSRAGKLPTRHLVNLWYLHNCTALWLSSAGLLC